MLLSLVHKLRIVQIPVNYLPRIGESAVTGDTRKAVWLGLWMIGLVWRFRLRRGSGQLTPRRDPMAQPHG